MRGVETTRIGAEGHSASVSHSPASTASALSASPILAEPPREDERQKTGFEFRIVAPWEITYLCISLDIKTLNLLQFFPPKQNRRSKRAAYKYLFSDRFGSRRRFCCSATTPPTQLTRVVQHRVEVPIRSPDLPDGHPVRVSVEHERLLAVVARCAQLSDALAASRHQVYPVESCQGRVENLRDRFGVIAVIRGWWVRVEGGFTLSTAWVKHFTRRNEKVVKTVIKVRLATGVGEHNLIGLTNSRPISGGYSRQ